MKTKQILCKLLFVVILIFNCPLPSMAETWKLGFNLFFGYSSDESTCTDLLEDSSTSGTRCTGGIDQIRHRVEELVEKLTHQHEKVKSDILRQNDSLPIAIYESNNDDTCENKSCASKSKFIGSLSPIKVQNHVLYMTTRHSLVDFAKRNKKLNFDPHLDFKQFKTIEFKADKSNDPVDMLLDVILIVPNTYFHSITSCQSDNNFQLNTACFNRIKTDILTQFTSSKANAYWLSAQPIIDNQNDIQWKFAAGIVNPTKFESSQPQNYPVHYFSLVNNRSNQAKPGVSGNLIRKIDFDSKINEPRIGKFIGLITCKSKVKEGSAQNPGFTFALNISSLFKTDNFSAYLTSIVRLSNEHDTGFNLFKQLDCDPIDGRGVGGY